jgi:hypothetical protein
MISLILLIGALVLALIHIRMRKKVRTTARIIEILLAYLIPLNIGVMSLIAFVAQAFYASELAEMMGWKPNPPLQLELAFMHLGFAFVGFYSIWQRKGFWLATVLTNVIFLFGCGWVRFSWLMNGMKATGQGYLFLYVNDLVVPLVLLILTLIYSKKHKFFKEKTR